MLVEIQQRERPHRVIASDERNGARNARFVHLRANAHERTALVPLEGGQAVQRDAGHHRLDALHGPLADEWREYRQARIGDASLARDR